MPGGACVNLLSMSHEYRIHPGRVSLPAHGCSVTRLAAAADLGKSAVSLQLSGVLTCPQAFTLQW